MKAIFSVRAFVLNTITVLGGSPTSLEIVQHAQKHCPSLYDLAHITSTLRDLRENGEIISAGIPARFSKRTLHLSHESDSTENTTHRPQLFS